VWSADIDVYGERRNVVGEKQACPFRWPGQYEDEETGLYYNRFRYYDSEAGEYTRQDPIRLFGGFRLYVYPENPSIDFDPFGLAGSSCIPDDEDFVRFDPTAYDSSIDSGGVQKRFFSDARVWLTKYKYVKHVTNASELEQNLYRKNLWPSTQGKFTSGGTLRVASGITDATPAGLTNKTNGVPQWFITRDIPASDLATVSRIPP